MRAKFWKLRYEMGLLIFLMLGLLEGQSKLGSTLLMGLMVLLIGMPHGAFDFFVLTKDSTSKWISVIKILCYTGLSAMMFLLWMILPHVFWLLAFGLSLWHFLSVEWSLKDSSIFVPDLAFASIFVLPILHSEDFLRVMRPVHGEPFANALLASHLIVFSIFGVIASLRLIFFPHRLRHLVVFTLSLLGMIALPIWYAFFSFFIVLHSARHLELSFSRSQSITRRDYWKVLLPISVLAMLPAIFLFEANQDFIVRMIICLLCLTAPHFVLEEWKRRQIC